MNQVHGADLIGLEGFSDQLKQYVNYYFMQKERGDQEGTEHWQGIFYSKKQLNRNAIHAWFPGMYVEIMGGSQQEAEKYCSKVETRIAGPYTWGKAGSQGERTDIASFKDACSMRGTTLAKLVKAHPRMFVNHMSGSLFVFSVLHKPRLERDIKVIVYFGPPGIGKSHKVLMENKKVFKIPIQQQKSMWFDGYCGQKVVLFDDFKGKIALDNWLQITDKWPVTVPVKGSYTYFEPEIIYVCSNSHPDTWYDWVGRPELRGAFWRRLTEVWNFAKVPPEQIPRGGPPLFLPCSTPAEILGMGGSMRRGEPTSGLGSSSSSSYRHYVEPDLHVSTPQAVHLRESGFLGAQEDALNEPTDPSEVHGNQWTAYSALSPGALAPFDLTGEDERLMDEHEWPEVTDLNDPAGFPGEVFRPGSMHMELHALGKI